ncbi:type VI secretion system Vgr family protein [Rhodopirellula sp. MGV]|uniref:type VI secretion system Vgr family protein n=1 Tax=Rhodopirellula sp. MGV TaxID=2023130 RepID=UPI000B96A5B6|nr:type VI secretion system tip protein TssI/VgrG [Rhodopirellula sp. MGV]OYP35815.1 hypothetical protein CGZ80_10470 [Rhodopirellula sp. MGV]PNY36372.1 type VI secretion system tip protein VgrG [Rhodopirellula baltica]
MSDLQQNRDFKIKTKLGADELLLYRMVVQEELSRPFEIRLELLSENHNVDLETLLGSAATVSIVLPSGSTRFFNGMFNRISWAGTQGHLAKYEATLVPWLWFLSRTSSCQIFQGKTAPDIIQEVFKANGFTDFTRSLSSTYDKRDYCVQYRESDFAFVSRLMEKEGMYYFFTHEDSKHVLQLCDSASSHSADTDYKSLRYHPPDPQRIREIEHIYQWGVSLEVQSGSYVHTDFDFERPKAAMESTSTVSRSHSYSDFEVYDYPGEYQQTATGKRFAQYRIEAKQANYQRARGTTNALGLCTGALFSLENHQRDDQNCEYLIVNNRIELTNSEYETGNENGGLVYQCDFETIKSATPYRSPNWTPEPYISGPQTAIVVGKSGEEIWTDSYGRVKVHFHWDRLDKRDENSSCWVRVAQSWAGKRWGSIHIPRIGQEVIVEFLEGDPDRPIITGRVYNADEMPPYDLPANSTQSGIKTQSTSKGNNQNFNELRFEDKLDKEQIYFHAERDFERVVENNDSLSVGFDKKADGNQDVKIYNNQTVEVGSSGCKEGNQTITVLNDLTETVKEGNVKVNIDKGNRTTTIKQGDDTLDIKAGKQTITAAKEIVLKVGPNSIKIDTQKITIKAVEISIQADTKVEIKGAMLNAEAQGVATIKGGLLKLN